ncbi:MAG: 30S ribosomal protein S9 [Desulfobacterota bacterium]|nr:30S ribosomal protein S9 [Thermodesulfobacteriota bacterium]MDW8002614.1 30S ribosomal protein S9 [Deltaproteobacteria bacterium]
MAEKRYYATGKRKTAVARVWIKQGQGNYLINGRSLEEYFPVYEWRYLVNRPFIVTNTLAKFDVIANVRGGGLTAQAWAIGHGIAKALVEYNQNLRPALKKEGLLRRDPRVKERKKYGRRGARRGFQFSKR